MSIRVVELGRIGVETMGHPSLMSPVLEVTPKTQRRNNISDTAV